MRVGGLGLAIKIESILGGRDSSGGHWIDGCVERAVEPCDVTVLQPIEGFRTDRLEIATLLSPCSPASIL